MSGAEEVLSVCCGVLWSNGNCCRWDKIFSPLPSCLLRSNSCFVAQAGLELGILLSQPSQCWDDRWTMSSPSLFWDTDGRINRLEKPRQFRRNSGTRSLPCWILRICSAWLELSRTRNRKALVEAVPQLHRIRKKFLSDKARFSYFPPIFTTKLVL